MMQYWTASVLLSIAFFISATVLQNSHSVYGDPLGKVDDEYYDYYEEAKALSGENDTNVTVTDAPTEVPLLVINTTSTPLPFCNDDELLLFDGVDLFCSPIPERECQCPGPMETTLMTPRPVGPPRGCTVFEPPDRGALVCLSVEAVQIYCSVMCDDMSEFSSFPLNPYTCGAITSFKWVDSTNRTRNILPECTGDRRSLHSSIFDEMNYLPGACDELSEEDAEGVRENFCKNLVEYFTFSFDSCTTEDVVIQCGD